MNGQKIYTYTDENANNRVLQQNNDGFERGKKLAKILGIIIIVLYSFNLAAGLLAFNILHIVEAGLSIFAATRFMKGKNGWRIFIGIIMVLATLTMVYYLLVPEYFMAIFSVGLDGGAALLFVKILCGVFILGYALMSYFILFNKNVKEYCEP